jgi:hypothetical protein
MAEKKKSQQLYEQWGGNLAAFSRDFSGNDLSAMLKTIQKEKPASMGNFGVTKQDYTLNLEDQALANKEYEDAVAKWNAIPLEFDEAGNQKSKGPMPTKRAVTSSTFDTAVTELAGNKEMLDAYNSRLGSINTLLTSPGRRAAFGGTELTR